MQRLASRVDDRRPIFSIVMRHDAMLCDESMSPSVSCSRGEKRESIVAGDRLSILISMDNGQVNLFFHDAVRSLVVI